MKKKTRKAYEPRTIDRGLWRVLIDAFINARLNYPTTLPRLHLFTCREILNWAMDNRPGDYYKLRFLGQPKNLNLISTCLAASFKKKVPENRAKTLVVNMGYKTTIPGAKRPQYIMALKVHAGRISEKDIFQRYPKATKVAGGPSGISTKKRAKPLVEVKESPNEKKKEEMTNEQRFATLGRAAFEMMSDQIKKLEAENKRLKKILEDESLENMIKEGLKSWKESHDIK